MPMPEFENGLTRGRMSGGMPATDGKRDCEWRTPRVIAGTPLRADRGLAESIRRDAAGCPACRRRRVTVRSCGERPDPGNGILCHTEGWQEFPSQEDLVQQTPKNASGAAKICFSLRIQSIRLERLPCIAPGCGHGNALPSCIGSPPAAATVLGPAKPAGIQVFATAAPIGICPIIIQFPESSGNNTTLPFQGNRALTFRELFGLAWLAKSPPFRLPLK